jgi:uncharacterized protein (DUF2252 family)
MTTAHVTHPSVDERIAAGRAARKQVRRSTHLGWSPAADRPDPVALLEQQNAARDADLVPVRHGRMLASPFTFYRGAARIMAVDLKDTARAGLDVQLCGDAHLSNFGVFASPERTLLFDLNDFDETLPGPFEYDVERLAASFVVAGRNNGLPEAESKQAALTVVREYRERMAEFAELGALAIWYSRIAAEETIQAIRATASKKQAKVTNRAGTLLTKARTKDSLQALSKLAEVVDGEYRIVSDPPLVVPMREIGAVYDLDADVVEKFVHDSLRDYRATLEEDRRHLLERYRIVDVARKVVGVGSVGTRAFIVLLQGRDDQDPLFLQVKEATASVFEDHLPKSRWSNHGERVVRGQRMMQAASDIFLGWTKGLDKDRHYYWRQLRDMKGSAEIEAMTAEGLNMYARLCGWALARAHARSGDPIAISSYLGLSDRFDQAMADFAQRYADQNERDYELFAAAVASGRLEATEGV